LAFTDEQQFLREAVRGAIEREAPLRAVREWVIEPASPESGPGFDLAARQGWTGIGSPEEHGGQGGEEIELAILAEELGRGAVPADGLYASLVAASALRLAGAHAAVAPLALGEQRAVLVHPGGQPADTAHREKKAPLVVGAAGATAFIVWNGASLERYAEADCEPRLLVDRTRSLADVTLHGEPIESLGGVEPSGMQAVAARAAVIVAADALGAAQRMLDLTVAYVSERRQFGVPVGSFQAVKHTAAEMLVAIEGTRAAVHYAAWSVAAGEASSAVDAWVAKSRAARVASFVADKALFLHGAVGYTWEHDLQILFKRAKSDGELFGGPGLYEDRIADSLSLVPEAVRARAQPVTTTAPSDARAILSS
jgi:alkylation response protein AidB-like acyl-CoA dehydrogenase